MILGTSSVRWQGIFADAANITAITGALTGNVTGQVSDISNHSTTNLTEGSNLYTLMSVSMIESMLLLLLVQVLLRHTMT
ncbi:MAG: hypothetical protein CM15mV41_1020 [Caudoviricetes sp.]|nr:MAG: hypothetical protein CM15mV41_1020 [Caudoviricetes sp.]